MDKPEPPKAGASDDAMILNEVQLLLAEKRTSLSMLRTGIAIFAFPLSVLSVLIATSKSYEAGQNLHFLVPLMALTGALIVLGSYLVLHSIKRVRHYDQLIRQLKLSHSRLAALLD